MKKWRRFQWDEGNISHIAEHDVTPPEVEEAVNGTQVITEPAYRIGRERRWKLYGRTKNGRYLVVVFTVRSHEFRAVTARSMHKSERRDYGPEIDS